MQKLGSTSRICIQAAAEAVPAAAALCRYLKERGMTQTRLAEDSEAGELQVVFSVPEAVSGWEEDQYSVYGSDGRIRIQAINSAGFFAAAGAVLFGLRFCADGHMEVPQYDLSGAPKMTYRASLLSIHQQDNGYKNWSREQFAAYMEDLALWGANVGMYLVLQFGQRSRKTFEAGTAEAEQWETIRQLPELVGDMGLKVGMYCGHNDVFAEDVQKLRYATDGPAVTMFAASEKSVCPSYPGAAEMIVQRRRELFEKLKRVDALYLPLSDFGGCACEDRQPYLSEGMQRDR